MSRPREPLPTQAGEIHLGMALEHVRKNLGNGPVEEFRFLGDTTCLRQRLDPASSPFESVTYCFAEQRLFSVIWEDAKTSPLASSVARFGQPGLQRQHEGDPAFVEHRWQHGDIEFIVTDFLSSDGSHSFAVEMCNARVKFDLALRARLVTGSPGETA